MPGVAVAGAVAGVGVMNMVMSGVLLVFMFAMMSIILRNMMGVVVSRARPGHILWSTESLITLTLWLFILGLVLMMAVVALAAMILVSRVHLCLPL